MNPLLIFFLLYLLSSDKNKSPFGSVDTFKMELALDNMNKVVNMAQKINGLGKSGMSFHPAASLPAPVSNPGSQPPSSGPDLGELMQTMGPILQMLSKGEK